MTERRLVMFKLRISPIVSAVLLILAGILAALPSGVSRGQGRSEKKSDACEPRRFYLTNSWHKGNEALSACATGYHMASLWEIHDLSNLKYDTTLGFTRSDAGSGPPANSYGWVRTGWDANETNLPGSSNCNAWTSESPFGEGTAVALHPRWSATDGSVISPWTAVGGLCFEPFRVWCLQD
jgi:hypothetical protein